MADRRLERDAVLRCPHCGEAPYAIWRRQNQRADGSLSETFGTVLWPNTPGVLPPADPTRICCLDCGHELRRVSA
jgi:hypothetical protein